MFWRTKPKPKERLEERSVPTSVEVVYTVHIEYSEGGYTKHRWAIARTSEVAIELGQYLKAKHPTASVNIDRLMLVDSLEDYINRST